MDLAVGSGKALYEKRPFRKRTGIIPVAQGDQTEIDFSLRPSGGAHTNTKLKSNFY